MKIIFQFDMDNPDDISEYKKYSKAGDMYLCLWDIMQYIRNEKKYNENLSDSEVEILEKVNDKMMELLDEYDLKNFMYS